MKNTLLIVLLLSCFTLSATEVALKDVARAVSKKNYIVLENAQLLYQSKESVNFARSNLLPQLNLWSFADLAFSWTGVLGLVNDVAPFLVPGNWFKLKQKKILHEAQRHGYHALWANQILTAKSLFYRIDHDQKLIHAIDKNISSLKEFHVIVKAKEEFGGTNVGDSKVLEQRIFELVDDKKRIEYLLKEEKNELKYILGIKSSKDITIKPLRVDLTKKSDLSSSKLQTKSISASPEIKQYSEFLRVIPEIKKEIRFSFLGTSSLNFGGMGVFSDLEIQKGLGFGAGNSVGILKSKAEVLRLQKEGISESIKKQIRVLTEIYNEDLDYYDSLSAQLALSESIQESYIERLQLGDTVNIWDIVDSTKSMMNAELQINSVISRHFENFERLERHGLSGDYSSLPNYDELIKVAEEED
jgi:hypothetical protein